MKLIHSSLRRRTTRTNSGTLYQKRYEKKTFYSIIAIIAIILTHFSPVGIVRLITVRALAIVRLIIVHTLVILRLINIRTHDVLRCRLITVHALVIVRLINIRAHDVLRCTINNRTRAVNCTINRHVRIVFLILTHLFDIQ